MQRMTLMDELRDVEVIAFEVLAEIRRIADFPVRVDKYEGVRKLRINYY
jgi:hypothetical protein